MKKYIILLLILIVLFLIKKERKYILFLRNKSPFNKSINSFRYSLYRKYNYYLRRKKTSEYVDSIHYHVPYLPTQKKFNETKKLLKNINYDNKTIIRGILLDIIIESKYNTTKLFRKYKNITKYYPKTVLHNDKNVINELKKLNLKSPIFLKNDQDGKKGIKVVNGIDNILKGFKNNYLLAQEQIPNPLKVKNYNFVIRFYVLIYICEKNSKTLYLPKYGKLNYPMSKKGLVTYTNKKTKGIDTLKGKPGTTTELSKYFKKDLNKILHNTSLEFFKTIKKDINKIKFLKNNSAYTIYGFDYMFDKDFNPYILELNLYPSMNPYLKDDVKINLKFYNEMILNEINILNRDFKSITYKSIKL